MNGDAGKPVEKDKETPDDAQEDDVEAEDAEPSISVRESSTRRYHIA